jgi:Domain of unknown function (DUF4432)
MACFKSWILTDVQNDVWIDSFSVGNDNLRLPMPHGWSIRKRTLRGGLRDGVDIIEVHNGALSYSLLPTRGMNVWRGQYHGNYLGWKAPLVGPVHPKFVNLDECGGLGWLAGFDELVCRCGLSSNGPPGEDVYTDRTGKEHRARLTLHGRISNTPAQYVEARVGLEPPHELTVVGQVEEGCLFFPHLLLTSTCTTVPGSNRLVIHDIVENRGGEPAELQMLYHCNFGPPFLEAGSRIVTPIHELAPLTARAAEGMDTYDTYSGPSPGFAEQVYCYDLLGDAAGRTLALLYNAAGDRGCTVRWNHNELSCFTLWRNTGAIEDGYVTGLEPATNYPNFKSFERKQGRVRLLPPLGRWECTLALEFHDTASAVSRALAEIVSLQAQAKPVIHHVPQARYSP